MDEPGDTKQIAKYNDAALGVARLHQHWIMAETYANSGKLSKWKYRLDSIWRELYPNIIRMSKSDAKQTEKVLSRNKAIMGRIAKAKNPALLYFWLNKRHELFREIQDIAGRGDIYVDEDEEAFE